MRSVAIYLPDLSGGGAERLHVGLAPFFAAAGFRVTLLLDRRRGELLETVPSGIGVETLDARRQLHALPRLVRYLRRAKPDILVANMEHMNIMSLVANGLARGGTRVVVCQHNTLSEQAKRPSWQFKALPWLYRIFVPRAAAIVAVSRGVALDIQSSCGIDAKQISVIYNGVIGPDFESRADEAFEESWNDEADPRPLIVAVGRMVPQKDYPTLLRAFAVLRQRRDARLLILGDGPLRGDLEATRDALGLGAKVKMPGFVKNPLPAIKAAHVLVMASRFEGFGIVLAEALACGTKVVSTNCPHGPAEILEDGRYGTLVPVGDAHAMADAIGVAIDADTDPALLRQRGRIFSLSQCARDYTALFASLLDRERAATVNAEGSTETSNSAVST